MEHYGKIVQRTHSGAAWSERGSLMTERFLTRSRLPWLPTPGGKGVVSDVYPK